MWSHGTKYKSFKFVGNLLKQQTEASLGNCSKGFKGKGMKMSQIEKPYAL